jgi:hypothetical protein
LYDQIGPSAPFTLVGIANGVVAVWALWLYLRGRAVTRVEVA